MKDFLYNFFLPMLFGFLAAGCIKNVATSSIHLVSKIFFVALIIETTFIIILLLPYPPYK
jgi:hypothetical protein